MRQLLNFRHHRGVDLLALCDQACTFHVPAHMPCCTMVSRLLALCDQLGAAATRTWMEAVCARPSVAATLPADNSLLAVPPYLQARACHAMLCYLPAHGSPCCFADRPRSWPQPFHEHQLPAAAQRAAVARALEEGGAARAAEASHSIAAEAIPRPRHSLARS